MSRLSPRRPIQIFSAVEVCGNITWFEDEFATEISTLLAWDAVLNAEGGRSMYFGSWRDWGDRAVGRTGVTYRGSSSSVVYCSGYPLNYADTSSSSYFFRASEYRASVLVGQADAAPGVAGFCL